MTRAFGGWFKAVRSGGRTEQRHAGWSTRVPRRGRGMLTCAGGYGGYGVCLSQKERFGQVLEDEEGASHGDTPGRQWAQWLVLSLELQQNSLEGLSEHRWPAPPQSPPGMFWKLSEGHCGWCGTEQAQRGRRRASVWGLWCVCLCLGFPECLCKEKGWGRREGMFCGISSYKWSVG